MRIVNLLFKNMCNIYMNAMMVFYFIKQESAWTEFLFDVKYMNIFIYVCIVQNENHRNLNINIQI